MSKKLAMTGVLKPGQSIFEINHDTLVVEKVVPVVCKTGRKELVMKKGCYYIPALNKENAIRKYTKMMLRVFSNIKVPDKQ